ncbi:hypothetical protein WU85_08405 [Corynebacterium striatum]|nr:hypothetical protein WU85_08405 [Corynebacterium striatum]
MEECFLRNVVFKIGPNGPYILITRYEQSPFMFSQRKRMTWTYSSLLEEMQHGAGVKPYTASKRRWLSSHTLMTSMLLLGQWKIIAPDLELSHRALREAGL